MQLNPGLDLLQLERTPPAIGVSGGTAALKIARQQPG